VLHVSLAAPRKNPPALAEAARRLDTPFKIAGSGWEEHFTEAPGTANVELLGYVPEDELIELYKSASVFYFPTLHEGFGLPVAEAMAAGAAVVTTNVFSVPEITDDAALLFDPDDVDAHVRAIRELLLDTARRRTLAERGRVRSQVFTWERAARETEAVYRGVL
jgi:alpha-1,3-rhamnosyl/mannosyltransferase